MVNSIDVAIYILEKIDRATTMKLQKLVYYAQARHIVYSHAKLFDDKIEAWANGPVMPALFHVHSGKYMVCRGDLDFAKSNGIFSDSEKSDIDAVIDRLGKCSGEQLRELSHNELPWKEARRGYAAAERCSVEISPKSILHFYSSPDCKNPVVH